VLSGLPRYVKGKVTVTQLKELARRLSLSSDVFFFDGNFWLYYSESAESSAIIQAMKSGMGATECPHPAHTNSLELLIHVQLYYKNEGVAGHAKK